MENDGGKDYVLGLEPSNHYLDGRKTIKERSELKEILPGEAKEFCVEIDFFNDDAAWGTK